MARQEPWFVTRGFLLQVDWNGRILGRITTGHELALQVPVQIQIWQAYCDERGALSIANRGLLFRINFQIRQFGRCLICWTEEHQLYFCNLKYKNV